jgi:hypothetical protein
VASVTGFCPRANHKTREFLFQPENTQQWYAATKEPGKGEAPDPELATYFGTYSSGFAGETAVFAWEDGLGMLGLPTMEPLKGIVKLKKTGEHTFRRVRKDEKLGEELAFEIGSDGKAARFRVHSNYQKRVN